MKKLVLSLLLASGVSFAAKTSPDLCQLKVNGVVLWTGIAKDGNGQGFYAEASKLANQSNTCVYAKIDQVPGSGRVYQADGSLSSDSSGRKKDLSNRQAAEAMRTAGGRCLVVSCIPLIDNNHPEIEQPVQAPTYPTVIDSGSNY